MKATVGTLSSSSHVEFTWEIDDFKYRCADLRKEPYISSPRFTSLKSKHEELSHDWKLKLYPYGELNDKYLSLYLEFCKNVENDRVKVALIKFSIINKSGKKVNEKVCWGEHFFSNHNYLRGFTKFASRSFVLNKENQLIHNHRLIISCEIYFKKCNDNVFEESKNDELSKDFESILSNGYYSDVTFIIDDRKIKVHKNVLSARSKVFADMFCNENQENNENVPYIVTLVDVKYDIVVALLKFIYSGQVENLDEVAKGLLAAADKYDISSLKSKCEDSLASMLTIQEACEFLSIAEVHNCNKLKTVVMEFIVANIRDVVKTSGFKTLTQSMPNLLAEILCVVAEK